MRRHRVVQQPADTLLVQMLCQPVAFVRLHDEEMPARQGAGRHLRKFDRALEFIEIAPGDLPAPPPVIIQTLVDLFLGGITA